MTTDIIQSLLYTALLVCIKQSSKIQNSRVDFVLSIELQSSFITRDGTVAF